MFLTTWRKRRAQAFSRRRSPASAAGHPGCWRPRVDPLEDRLLLSTYTVTNTLDGGAGSLRQAIRDSNGTAGPNLIDFRIGTGAQTIRPLSAYQE